ncbi:hypothetical protein WJX72_001798 [[Myrmecia] bisecta]|uniref:Uncharacterized protein n=1 Tax=[Myrmecia] bisecta TaxID=41462 RepID=A0AAW1P812_9CHLO
MAGQTLSTWAFLSAGLALQGRAAAPKDVVGCARRIQHNPPILKGGQLLKSIRVARAVGGQDTEGDFEEMMLKDMERLRQRQAKSATSGSRSTADEVAPETSGGALDGVKNVLDKVLIADFFFVCLALVWLGAGVAETAALKSSTLSDAWLQLWPLVFQPAIGVLMLGAILSGVVGWLKNQQST